MTPYSFKAITFSNVRAIIPNPVAASVRKSNPKLVNIRIAADLAKKCAFKPNELITPFVDAENRAVLLLSGQRPAPKSSRPIHSKGDGGNRAMEIDFPRADEFAELFPERGMRGMELKEAGAGRLVFVVPKV
jgi:hypothetical protein